MNWINSTFRGKSDSRILESLIKIHAPAGVDRLKILDCTYNRGQMWKGFSIDRDYLLETMDIDPIHKTDYVCDFMEMPMIKDASFDILVFDPPHLPGRSKGASGIYEKNYGIIGPTKGREKNNVIGMFKPFMEQAKRVLKIDGIVLVKICDLVQGRRYQWQHVDLINIARDLGMTPCDLAVKVGSGSMISSKWKNPYHLRKNHSYWIVIRLKGCQRKRVRS